MTHPLDKLDAHTILGPRFGAQKIADKALLAQHSRGHDRQYHIGDLLKAAAELQEAVGDLRAEIDRLAEEPPRTADAMQEVAE
jgi:hypothetical protein